MLDNKLWRCPRGALLGQVATAQGSGQNYSGISNRSVCIYTVLCDDQGPDFDDMSSFFPCEIDDAIQYINLGYGVQAPIIVIL